MTGSKRKCGGGISIWGRSPCTAITVCRGDSNRIPDSNDKGAEARGEKNQNKRKATKPAEDIQRTLERWSPALGRKVAHKAIWP